MNRVIKRGIYTIAVLIMLVTSSASVNASKPELQIEPGIYVFVSFSMNDESLRSYFIEANHYGAKLVLRGLVGEKHSRNRFADTKAKINKARIIVDINPNLFEHLGIKQVPAIAVVNTDRSIKKISGHITLQKALELMDVSISKDKRILEK